MYCMQKVVHFTYIYIAALRSFNDAGIARHHNQRQIDQRAISDKTSWKPSPLDPDNLASSYYSQFRGNGDLHARGGVALRCVHERVASMLGGCDRWVLHDLDGPSF